jgi:hypothetical protein
MGRRMGGEGDSSVADGGNGLQPHLGVGNGLRHALLAVKHGELT